MEFKNIDYQGIPVEIKLASFGVGNGSAEHHAILCITDASLCAKSQSDFLRKATARLIETLKAPLVWQRFFMSDPANQKGLIPTDTTAATSITGQAPLDYTKMALWCYFAEGAQMEKRGLATVMRHSGFEHHYYTRLHDTEGHEYDQTISIFNTLRRSLNGENISFANELVRTWIYVQGVDVHYAGMVRARIDIFNEENLTADTHYITSTGIGGRFTEPKSLVYMDAYAVKGLKAGQQQYLYALDRLSPTNIYGVTFERGTAVKYADRKHIFISGTASIDNKGEILHPGDVIKQAERALFNIDGLLAEADANLTDIAQLIIYLRDIADYPNIKAYLEQQLPDTPKVYVAAAVCRPGWLIEMECIAVCENDDKNLPNY